MLMEKIMSVWKIYKIYVLSIYIIIKFKY